MEKSIINDTSVISKSAESTVDSSLTELVRIVKTLELSVDNRYIKNLTGDVSNTPHQMYNLSVRMREFAASNSLIKRIYAYYPNTDYVVSTVGAYKADHYYYLDNGHKKEGIDQWKSLITQVQRNSFCIYKTAKEKEFCYVDKLYNAGSLVVTFVIEIDNSKMSEILSSSRSNDGIAFVMLIDNDPIIVSGDQELFTDNSEVILSSRLKEGTNIQNGIYVFAHASKLSGLSYMTLHKSKGLLHVTYTLVKACVICLIGCLVFIIAISAFIGRKQHKNIKIIMDKLGDTTGDKVKDEYSIIADRIDQLVSVAYKDSRQMLKYQSMLNSLFLSFVLQNRFDGEADFARVAIKYGISFEYLSYRIATIQVPGDSSDIFTIESNLLELQEIDSENMLDCFATYSDDSYIILINSDSSVSDDSLCLTIKKYMDTVFSNVEACAGLGSSYSSPLCVGSSYSEALSALSDVSASCSHQVSVYDAASAASNTVQKEIGVSDDIEKGQIKAKREPVVANQAKDYIDKNFTDPLLGLYSISEKLHVNNSYLSTIFKTAFGINILQYINKKRIEKAKELILSTDKSIKEIAQLSGFSSDINFIRVFKKYENKTPSAYRDTD